MKFYMTETTLGIVAALILSTAANAFPAHQQDGYRDTGCDPAQQVQVEGTNYYNNPSCPMASGATDGFAVAAVTPAHVDPEEPTDPEEEEPAPVDPEPEYPSCKSAKGC